WPRWWLCPTVKLRASSRMLPRFSEVGWDLRPNRRWTSGRLGCLEAYCSATGVARTAREILSSTSRPSLLREKPLDEIESLDVSIAAGKGDEVANEIFQFTGKMLGEACADFAAFSSPEAFIFFGGLCKAGDLIMNPIKEAYDKTVLKIFRGKAKFLVSGLMNANAAVLGASALGWED
ncbi:MAG: ROK family protein, partial [Bacteroidaceae bacterium]|nr:ROK family protein [Bacteroidaceae bacterium]